MTKLKPILLILFYFTLLNISAQRDFSDSQITKVAMLGSGNPNPSPFQSGCSLAIIVNDIGWRVNSHEFTEEGEIYQDENVKVEAFPVSHGEWPNAWGFRFTTPDKVIVISGDTKPTEKIIEYAKGADILIHEVYYKKGYDTKPLIWKNYHAEHHTSSYEVAEIANKTKPKLIVLYHVLYWGGTDEDILMEISETYDGKVIVGKDLDVY